MKMVMIKDQTDKKLGGKCISTKIRQRHDDFVSLHNIGVTVEPEVYCNTYFNFLLQKTKISYAHEHQNTCSLFFTWTVIK